jgi:hypothetical protein
MITFHQHDDRNKSLFSPFSVSVTVETDHICHQKTTRHRRHKIDDCGRREVGDNELQASNLTLRTIDVDDLRKNAHARFRAPNGPGLIARARNKAARGAKRARSARHQSYQRTMFNELLGIADTIKRNDKQLNAKEGDEVPGVYGIFGKPIFGSKSSSNRKVIAFLAKFMTVFLLDEEYTSKVQYRHSACCTFRTFLSTPS